MRDAESSKYPDVSDILARKLEGRRSIAARSFAEKISLIEAMRERLAPLKRAREARRAAQPIQAPGDDVGS
jgi:hypothetical protein